MSKGLLLCFFVGKEAHGHAGREKRENTVLGTVPGGLGAQVPVSLVMKQLRPSSGKPVKGSMAWTLSRQLLQLCPLI